MLTSDAVMCSIAQFLNLHSSGLGGMFYLMTILFNEKEKKLLSVSEMLWVLFMHFSRKMSFKLLFFIFI